MDLTKVEAEMIYEILKDGNRPKEDIQFLKKLQTLLRLLPILNLPTATVKHTIIIAYLFTFNPMRLIYN